MAEGPKAPESAAETREGFSALLPELIEKAIPSLQESFKLREADLEALRDNREGSPPCFVLEYEVEACSLVFVSRGFEENTGYSAELSLGKTLTCLEIKAASLNNFINKHELSYIDEFCQLGDAAAPNASIDTLVLHEREQGDRFWHVMHMQYVTLQGKQYIFCMSSVLAVPLPTVIREACLPDATQFSCFLDALQSFLEQLRSNVHHHLLQDTGSLQEMVSKSILTFMKRHTTEFEGDHWVPLVGQDKTYAFQQDVKWAGILAKVQNSLYKIWEVSERHDEVVACAVSDPTGEDCPLVYVSREFEKFTGYQREWVLGRNCRFLQPNHCWRNSAFNKEECLRMRYFCKRPLQEHTRMVNLLVNERKDGYPFWNLLVMEHIEIESDPKTSLGGVDRHHYIFGVQTNLCSQVYRLSELLSMDTRSLIELRRLREIFRQRESSLQTQSLNSFARDCISIWASSFPAALELPRLQLPSLRGRFKVSIPIIGLEINAHSMTRTLPAALQDGIRHFYLTFPPSAHGDVSDARVGELEVKLLSLRLAQVFASLTKTFLHYLRGAITFTLVTPPLLVKFYGAISKSMHAHGYKIGSWLLDVRGIDAKHCPIPKAVECWQFMSEQWRYEEVQSLGLCGAGKELFESLQRVPTAAPVSAFGVELFPGKLVPDTKYLQRAESAQRNGDIPLIAFNAFGPKQALLEFQEFKDEAYRRNTDVAMLLTKWCSSQVDALMVPVTTSGKGRPQRRKIVSQSMSGASMTPDEPSKVEANVHRSFIKAFNSMTDIEGLEQLVANKAEPRNAEVAGQARRRSAGTAELSGRRLSTAGDAAGPQRAGLAAMSAAQALPALPSRRRSSAVSQTFSVSSECPSPMSPPWSPRSARLPQRNSTFDDGLRDPTRDGSKSSTSTRAESKRMSRFSTSQSFGPAASLAARSRTDSFGIHSTTSHLAEQAASSTRKQPVEQPPRSKSKPLAPLQPSGPLPASGNTSQEAPAGSSKHIMTSVLLPGPPAYDRPPDVFRRPCVRGWGTKESEIGDGASSREQTLTLQSDGASSQQQTELVATDTSTSDCADEHQLPESAVWSFNARVAAKLLTKGMDLSDIADTLGVDVQDVQNMVMSKHFVLAGG